MVPYNPPTDPCTLAALNTATTTQTLLHSDYKITLLTRENDILNLRHNLHTLADDNDELRDLLQTEEARADAFETLVRTNLTRAEEAENALSDVESDLRAREQELQVLVAEKEALKNVSSDATAALREKLALTRELSQLRPQIDHLRAQASATETLTTEKLALQREITNIQIELEKARRETQRALAKRRNTGVEIAQEEQVEELKRALAEEKRARARAEEAAAEDSGDKGVDDVRKLLAKERKARVKAEEALEAANEGTRVEDVRRDLLREKKDKVRLEEVVEELTAEVERVKNRAKKRSGGDEPFAADGEVQQLRADLVKEKKDRVKAERSAALAAAEFEAQRATLDDKLQQFRVKLKSTKEKLKAAETELASAREGKQAATTKTLPSIASAPAAKANPKKRPAAQLDPEASHLGTPGDGPAAKKNRKIAAQGVGDKSTFTLTPFLNKTASVIGEDEAQSEGEESPAVAAGEKRQVLGSKSNIQNTKPTSKAGKSKTKPTTTALEILTEEAEPSESERAQGQENQPPKAGLKIKTKTTDGPEDLDPSKPKKTKPRKSLLDFASFKQATTGPEAEIVKKKRKLGGGLGLTLFDAEEGEGEAGGKPGLGAGGRGMFGMKGFGAFGGKSLGMGLGGGKMLGGRSAIGSSLLAQATSSSRAGGVGSTLLTAGDGSGFQFSPLKRNARRNLDDTLRG